MWLDTASPLDLDWGLAMGISSLAQRGVRCQSTNQCLLQTVAERSSRAAINLALTQDVTRDQTNLSDWRQISEWVMVRLCRSKARGPPEVDADHSLRGTCEAPGPGGNGPEWTLLSFPVHLTPSRQQANEICQGWRSGRHIDNCNPQGLKYFTFFWGGLWKLLWCINTCNGWIHFIHTFAEMIQSANYWSRKCDLYSFCCELLAVCQILHQTSVFGNNNIDND